MTTLLASNQKTTINLNLKGYRLVDGDRLLVGAKEELEKAEKFLDDNGFGGLYFDPEGDDEQYSNFMFESVGDKIHAIRFYN